MNTAESIAREIADAIMGRNYTAQPAPSITAVRDAEGASPVRVSLGLSSFTAEDAEGRLWLVTVRPAERVPLACNVREINAEGIHTHYCAAPLGHPGPHIMEEMPDPKPHTAPGLDWSETRHARKGFEE